MNTRYIPRRIPEKHVHPDSMKGSKSFCSPLLFHIYNIFVDLPFHFSTIWRYAQKRAVCSSSSGIDFRTSVDVSHSQLSNDTMHIRVI